MNAFNRIIAAGNTYNPCLLVLSTKGYLIFAECLSNGRPLWCAIKDGHEFSAYSPPELLGIVGLWEAFGNNWNRQTPDLVGEILSAISEQNDGTIGEQNDGAD